MGSVYGMWLKMVLYENEEQLEIHASELSSLVFFSGPLEVTDVTKSGCHLKWKAPEDDGGKPITSYIIEKMDKATGRWVPVSRTDGNVTECPVKGLQEGHDYMFRVKAVNDEGESEPLESDVEIKAKDPYGNNSPCKMRILYVSKSSQFCMR